MATVSMVTVSMVTAGGGFFLTVLAVFAAVWTART